MKSSILIVSYRKDFPYLRYCLRSITKYAKGFDTVLLVPNQDFDTAVDLVRQECPPCVVRSGDEWPGKGMLWHMAQEMRAEEHCQGDFIMHMDADCAFMEPVNPESFFVFGKPMLLFESFASMNRKGIDECNKWQVAAQDCLPFKVEHETMRMPCMMYHRALYARARQIVEQKMNLPFDEWMKAGRNEFPQDRVEYNTLGNVAIHEFASDYYLWDLETHPWPPKRVHQGWGHNGMRTEDMEAFKKAGLE